jgi:hypothetical protein
MIVAQPKGKENPMKKAIFAPMLFVAAMSVYASMPGRFFMSQAGETRKISGPVKAGSEKVYRICSSVGTVDVIQKGPVNTIPAGNCADFVTSEWELSLRSQGRAEGTYDIVS